MSLAYYSYHKIFNNRFCDEQSPLSGLAYYLTANGLKCDKSRSNCPRACMHRRGLSCRNGAS